MFYVCKLSSSDITTYSSATWKLDNALKTYYAQHSSNKCKFNNQSNLHCPLTFWTLFETAYSILLSDPAIKFSSILKKSDVNVVNIAYNRWTDTKCLLLVTCDFFSPGVSLAARLLLVSSYSCREDFFDNFLIFTLIAQKSSGNRLNFFPSLLVTWRMFRDLSTAEASFVHGQRYRAVLVHKRWQKLAIKEPSHCSCILKSVLIFSCPQPSSFLSVLESPFWCFSSLANHYFWFQQHFKVIPQK